MSKLTTFHSHLANPKQLSLPPLLMLALQQIQMQCTTTPPEKKKKSGDLQEQTKRNPSAWQKYSRTSSLSETSSL